MFPSLLRLRFRAPEPLFNPTILNGPDSQEHGIHEIAYASISGCDIDVRHELYGNIVLAGGTTMISGFADRVQKELTQLAPPNAKVKRAAHPLANLSLTVVSDHGICAFGTEVFGMDWRVNPSFSEHLPEALDP
jgi:Actin